MRCSLVMLSSTNVNQSQIAVTARRNALRAQAVKNRLKTLALQILVLVVIVGAWQILSSKKIIDPFFFSSPFDIVKHIETWVVSGTSQGPLYIHFVVTFEETILSFIIGVVLGVIMGYALGTNKLLSDIF